MFIVQVPGPNSFNDKQQQKSGESKFGGLEAAKSQENKQLLFLFR